MVSTRLPRCAAIASLLFASACGGANGDSGPDRSLPDPIDEPTADGSGSGDVADPVQPTDEPEVSSAPNNPESADAEPAAGACALLDETFLNETFDGQTGTFGDPYQFQTGLPSPDGRMCTWNDASTGLSLRMTLEDTASAETADHTGRAYNIDVEPLVDPQDGPGTQAVLLVDPAFDDDAGFPYGYFFVQGDVTVFVETVGLDVGADGLRKLADEASVRLANG